MFMNTCINTERMYRMGIKMLKTIAHKIKCNLKFSLSLSGIRNAVELNEWMNSGSDSKSHCKCQIVLRLFSTCTMRLKCANLPQFRLPFSFSRALSVCVHLWRKVSTESSRGIQLEVLECSCALTSIHEFMMFTFVPASKTLCREPTKYAWILFDSVIHSEWHPAPMSTTATIQMSYFFLVLIRILLRKTHTFSRLERRNRKKSRFKTKVCERNEYAKKCRSASLPGDVFVCMKAAFAAFEIEKTS